MKLLPTPEQAAALEATLGAVNDAANLVSGIAHTTGASGERRLRQLTYGQLKARGLGAQAAQHVIKKVVDAHTTLRGLIRNVRLKGRRARRAIAKPIAFRLDAAQPFDDRCLSWLMEARTVSIWTVRGRVKDIAFTGQADQLTTLAAHRHGESDLLLRDGVWYLLATCEVPETPLATDPQGWIGVDRGIVNLATTSDGTNYTGTELNRYRRRMARVRPNCKRATAKARNAN